MYACQYGKLEAVRELITFRPERAQAFSSRAEADMSEAKTEPMSVSETKASTVFGAAPGLEAGPEGEGEGESQPEAEPVSIAEMEAEAGPEPEGGPDIEDEYDEDEESFDEEAMFENEITIRAKWTMDGAETLDQAIEYLHSFADSLAEYKAEGWELRDSVGDDYGFLELSPLVANFNLKNKVLPSIAILRQPYCRHCSYVHDYIYLYV